MNCPMLTELNASRSMIDVFGGYNHNLQIREGEFFDMQNLTSADYPVLSPRYKRGIYRCPTTQPAPKGLAVVNDELCYVDGNDLYINKDRKIRFSDKIEDAVERTIIQMGSYLIIMPDKRYYNVNNPNDSGYIEHEFLCVKPKLGTIITVTFSPAKLDGTDYSAPAQDTAPQNPQNLQYWLDTSGDTHVLKQYSEAAAQWVSLSTTYIKISTKLQSNDPNDYRQLNIDEEFEVGDSITISGIYPSTMTRVNGGEELTEAQKNRLKELNSTMVIRAKGSGYILVSGMLDVSCVQECGFENDKDYPPILFERKMPEMDYVIESGNRLWGCRFGTASNGETVNEIYASKLGDFKNWNCFDGISTDSYVASVGSDGRFTGAITYLGYPLFFKENYIHKVYGNYPANFQVQTTACRGVQQGCSKSLAIVGETLCYKSRTAVCAYDGSLPTEISAALGDVSYSDAVAGALGSKYYISMKQKQDEHYLFVYDASKGMWHKEDKTQAVQFCNCHGNLYYIDYDDKSIKLIRVEEGEDEEAMPIEWDAITGIIGVDSPDKKYISSLIVRIKLDVGTVVRFFAEYDSSGEYEHLFTMTGTRLQSFSVPIRPKRCDHLRLKIVGKGMAKIYSICKTIEQGGAR